MKKMVLITIFIMLTSWTAFLQWSLIRPLSLPSDVDLTEKKVVLLLGESSRHLAPHFLTASKATGNSTDFLISLAKSESDGNERAVSSTGHKGLMQIPFAVYYPDANILIGSRIFNEKMVLAKGNVKRALCLYKGYDYDTVYGRKKAEIVLSYYYRLLKGV
jgi:soluble lytic murein transglycosylase-like protein